LISTCDGHEYRESAKCRFGRSSSRIVVQAWCGYKILTREGTALYAVDYYNQNDDDEYDDDDDVDYYYDTRMCITLFRREIPAGLLA